jgi:hypothetical protein
MAKGKDKRTKRPAAKRAVLRTGSLRPLIVTEDVKVAAFDLRTSEDFREALSRLCGREVTTACVTGAEPGCGTCPTCTAGYQFPRLRAPWTLGKLNQALVLGQRPTMSDGFYKCFFPPDASDAELLAGITQFRAYAMLRFGGFLIGYDTMAALSEREVHTLLRPYSGTPGELRATYKSRTHGQDLIRKEDIPIDTRWYLGYLSAQLLVRDLMVEEALRWKIEGRRPKRSIAAAARRARNPQKYDKDVRTYRDGLTPEAIKVWRRRIDAKRRELEEMDRERTRLIDIGQRNSAAYLAASHIDVYVATSMREPWEYEAMARVADDIFGNPRVKGLNVTMFDPTLSYYESRYDKGLVEGLMLNRASVTIYMVQETDTLGKDSELAATLAYGRPVIAYVPQYTKDELVAELRSSRLRRTFTRLLMLLAAGAYSIEKAELGLSLMRKFSPIFVLDPNEEDSFREAHADDLEKVYSVVADAEVDSLDDRARMLAEIHPLGLQLQQGTGVACGILLARTPKRCAELLAQLLTNEVAFRIEEDDHATVLKECGAADSEATYRVVTKDPVLTNSFWTHYRP